MTNKLKYFVGNWKMFGDFASSKIASKIDNYAKIHKKKNSFKVILCIPNTLLYFFTNKTKLNRISIGAQNCHPKESYGPHTGFVNSAMLKKAGAQYIILGHSENRSEGESNDLIKQKVISATKQKLTVILCIGETLKEKRNGKTFSVLKRQLLGCLGKKSNINKILLAYEPVWSIGTNKVPNQNNLVKITKFIKKTSKSIVKSKKSLTLLYGGSVNPTNINIFSSIHDIDGFLIGGASQSSNKFIDIIKNYYK